MVGAGVGAGIMAVPYLAQSVGLVGLAIILPVAWAASALVHLMLAEVLFRTGTRPADRGADAPLRPARAHRALDAVGGLRAAERRLPRQPRGLRLRRRRDRGAASRASTGTSPSSSSTSSRPAWCSSASRRSASPSASARSCWLAWSPRSGSERIRLPFHPPLVPSGSATQWLALYGMVMYALLDVLQRAAGGEGPRPEPPRRGAGDLVGTRDQRRAHRGGRAHRARRLEPGDRRSRSSASPRRWARGRA